MRNGLMMIAAFGLAACGGPAAEAPAPETAAAASSASSAATETPTANAQETVDRSAAPAGVYANDPGHSYITFSYSHMGYSKPTIRWGSWKAELNWNPAAPEESSVTATIDVDSVDTGVEKLDAHLRSGDFFESETYPTIEFKSASLETTGPNEGRMTGDLTIKGVTKPITLDVRINRAADDGFAKAYKLGFSAKGKLNRSDFGVDLYVPMVSDEIELSIESEFVMPKEQPEQP